MGSRPSAPAWLSGGTSFKPLGLAVGLSPPCTDSQVASPASQSGCAPSLGVLRAACLHKACRAAVQLVGKLWQGGWAALFPLGNWIKARAGCRGTGKEPRSSCSPALGKMLSSALRLIRLKN